MKVTVDFNRQRVALVALTLVAFTVGGVLFQPAFQADLSAPADGTGVPGETGTEQSTPTPTERVTQTQTERASPMPTERATPTTTPTESETPTPTEEETTTAVPADAETGDSGGWLSVVGSLAVVGGLLVLGLYLALKEGPDAAGTWQGLDIGFPSLPIPTVSLPRVSQITTALLLTSAGGLARVFDDLTTIGRGVVGALGSGSGPALGMAVRGLVSVPAALGRALTAPVAALGSVSLSVFEDGLSSGESRSRPGTDARDSDAPEPSTDDSPDPPASVTEAWSRMTERVPVSNPDATTPSEYARAAVEHGLPAGPVGRLTDLFRRIRYGPGTETDGHLATAREALAELRGGEDR